LCPRRTVDSKTLLLIDSGGQYDCGTTDITRTMHFGSPTEHQRRCYTRVLQGHIALSQVSAARVIAHLTHLMCNKAVL
jgi:Xaa-Pro aminopeptidase